MTEKATRPTSSNVYNAWQKAHHHKDKVEGFWEKLKSHGLKEEAEEVELAVIHLKTAAEKLTAKLLNRGNKSS